jgi:hypothetical protein
MIKVSSNQIEIENLAQLIKNLESDISDYNNKIGCMYFLSLLDDGTYINSLYDRLEEARNQYAIISKFQ